MQADKELPELVKKAAAMVVYDPHTGLMTWRRKTDAEKNSNHWNSSHAGKECGAVNEKGYRRIQFKFEDGVILRIAAHRLAWAIYYGELPTQIDHHDRNRLNNRIDNLRIATQSQNNANRGSFGRVPAKGVSWNKREGKYRADIKINGRQKFLGNFDTVDEAAHAYNKVAVRCYGEFALLNPIGQDKGQTNV